MAAQLSRRAVSRPATVNPGKQHHGDAGIERVFEVKRGGHHQEREKERPLEDANDLLAKTPHPVDSILSGDPKRDDRQHNDQRQLGQDTGLYQERLSRLAPSRS